MMKRLGTALAAAVMAALTLAPSASAAAEFGSNCSSNTGAPALTVVSLAHGGGSPLPVTAPISGVITQWKSNTEIEAPPEVLPLLAPRMQLFRPTGAPNQFIQVGEATASTFVKGQNVYQSRVPVQAGDHLGIGGNFVSLFCSTGDPADVSGFKEGSVSSGQSVSVEPENETQVPIAAVIEPDADADNYGDETQDLCPQSAAYQSACPVVTIDASSFGSGRKAVTVYVTTSLAAPVSVNAVAKLGKGKKATLKSAPRTVAPGELSKFKVAFPAKLRTKLKELTPKQKLTLKITASATNVTGAPSTDQFKVKLKGQGT